MSPLEAALKGANEVGFTVLSMSISLIAVFIPILLMGGIVGRLFREFAMTISIAIMISLAISLATTPMMCAVLLRGDADQGHGRLYQASERFFDRMLDFYRRTLTVALRHPGSIMLILAAVARSQFLPVRRHPEGLLPAAGYRARDRLDPGRSKHFVSADAAEARAVRHHHQAGSGGRNRGRVYRRAARPIPASSSSHCIRSASARFLPTASSHGYGAQMAVVPGATMFLQAVQDIRVGGRASNAQYQYTLQGPTLEELNEWSPKITAALQREPKSSPTSTATSRTRGWNPTWSSTATPPLSWGSPSARSTTRSMTRSASARFRPSMSPATSTTSSWRWRRATGRIRRR